MPYLKIAHEFWTALSYNEITQFSTEDVVILILDYTPHFKTIGYPLIGNNCLGIPPPPTFPH
ncbi:unnamed protein product [Meloidogyne enterolobii]|uniref:Uncharacterized protein n=1 Tax=Meloidogyne enterolobii TaxID=390850 RepID=A0ACB1AQI3_MELEN